MRLAAINLIKEIRLHYPAMQIMLNRGFDAFPEIALPVDKVLVESALVDNSTPKSPKYFDEAVYQEIVGQLKRTKEAAPQLSFYSLDYWDPKDVEGVKKIYQKQRMNELVPYVATPDLRKVIVPDAL
jgi:polysaccharide biosynthesis protein PelA